MNEFWSWFEEYAVPRLSKRELFNRSNTFRKMLEHLDKFTNPVIIETGCINTQPEKIVQDPRTNSLIELASDISQEDWIDSQWAAAGCSTIIFDKYVSLNGGHLYSVEISPEIVAEARKLVNGKNTTIVCSDSISYLKDAYDYPHLVYLDASHLYWHIETEAQVHHYNELMAIMPRLTTDTLVAIDDSPSVIDEQVNVMVSGKGGLVAKYAAELGVPLVFSEFQSAWLGFPGFKANTLDSNEEMLAKARMLVESGNQYQAYPIYRNLLVRTPIPWRSGRQRIVHGEACVFFARLALQWRRFGAAFDWYKRALVADPRATDYRVELVNKVLLPMGMHVSAKMEAERASNIDPDDSIVWRTLGNVEATIGNSEKALVAYRKQVEISNKSALSMLDLVTVLLDAEKYDEAEAICDKLLKHNDKKFMGDTLHCLAMIKARRDNHEEAIEIYKQALELSASDIPLVHFNLSLSLHSIGRYKEGFEHLSKRINAKTNLPLFVPMRRFTKPLFQMQNAPAVVHVHSEAGDGDNICLMRYLPMLAEKGYTVRYETRSNLLKLANNSLKNVEIVPLALDHPGGLGIKDFDYHLPVGELPYQFGTDIDTVPWYGPYIKADPELTKNYKEFKGKIGIAWSAGVRDEGIWLKRYGQLKSLSYHIIKPIITVNPERFVSLQIGPPRQENDFMIGDILSEDPNWAETAALIENLDLVITPDTGLAHLAGAMGKPCWIMMHGYNSGWHFMCERPGASWNERSPWYPSVRLFRQKVPGEWSHVVNNIAIALEDKLKVAA